MTFVMAQPKLTKPLTIIVNFNLVRCLSIAFCGLDAKKEIKKMARKQSPTRIQSRVVLNGRKNRVVKTSSK